MASLFPVVMAGGAGTRFWPLSRRVRPKQLLALAAPGETMLGATVRRVLPLSRIEDVLVVTGESIAALVRSALPAIPEAGVLAEPIGRNTAPCIGWAALHARRRDPDGVMMVLPADHAIGDEEAFLDALRRASAAAASGAIVTIGIEPTGPETGYGYIEAAQELRPGIRRAARFVEKPSLDTARAYLESGRYLWNSGMFFFTPRAILEAIERSMPDLHAGLVEIDRAIGTADEDAAVRRVYPRLPSQSIDYGVMEKAQGILVCPASFGWNDVGSWAAAYDLRVGEADLQGNVTAGELVSVGASGCLAWAEPRKVIALVGVRDLVVVDTADALLVCPRHEVQKVKDVVQELEKRGRTPVL